MKHMMINRLPAELVDDLEREIQADSIRPIKFVRTKDGVNKIDINYGTLIKIPTNRPPRSVGYHNPIYKMMEFLDMLRPADGGWMNAQEQFDWIKIANKHGFKGL